MAALRIEPPCTRDQRLSASLDTVRSVQRSRDKRGRIYDSGSSAKGAIQTHRSPCHPADMITHWTGLNVQGAVGNDRGERLLDLVEQRAEFGGIVDFFAGQ